MAAEIRLSELPVGASAIVRHYPSAGSGFLRLREMGLLPGTPVTVVRTAPLGDPLDIKVRGSHLSLRKSDAAHIVVEPT